MKKGHTIGTVAVLLSLLVWGLPGAHADNLPWRFQTRAKVWDIHWNTGTQGVREGTLLTYYRPIGMMYPGTFMVQFSNEFIDYWSVRQWAGATQWLAWMYEMGAIMPGFDTFVVTSVPGAPDGQYHVAESKPTFESEDIVPLDYDPSQGPEANIGYPNYSPLGPPMANWWPGEPSPGDQALVEIHNYRKDQYMDPDKDMFPESLMIAHYATKRGINVTKRVLAWGYPEYDDFEIVDYTFENVGDQQLNDTFFAFSVRFMVSHAGHMWHGYNAWYRNTNPTTDSDDFYKYTEASNYDGPASGVGLKMWYAFDADNPLVPGDDLGQPYSVGQARWHNRVGNMRIEGEMTGYQYGGLAPLAYMPGSANDASTWTYDPSTWETGDANYVAPGVADQPYKVAWTDYRNRGDYDQPDSKTHSYETMYNLLAGAPGIQDPPTEPTAVHGTTTYGPYDLAPGDKVRLVFVLAAAAPVEENIWGWAKLGDQDVMRTDRTFDNLVKHVNAAKDAFTWGYDLPDPPPDVGVTVGVSNDGFNKLSWNSAYNSASDPDYAGGEANDIAGYRVYRSEFKVGDWQLMADIPVGTAHEFVDEKSVAGFTYFYSVRGYDKGHDDWNGTGMAIPSLEGSNSSPETWANGVLPQIPYVPATSAADALQTEVIVVPNPYKVDGAHAYPARGRIRFLNIPHKCRIWIYTTSGDLAARVEHDDPTRGEANWEQVDIHVTGEVSPGMYYYVVESLLPGSQGEIQKGAFMIIK